MEKKKILIVNKFLYPNGGSETYIFELGKQLQREGHQVQYFGMQDERNIVGNRMQSYTSNMDFHGSRLSKLFYPFKIIYSAEARRAIRKVLEDFKPDVVHLNNFNFQITPSVIFEIRKYEKQEKKKIKILFTAHDYQLVCPNHMMRCPKTETNCNKCLEGVYLNCVKGSCIHGSKVKSILGAAEGYFYRIFKAYREIDVVICPSRFIERQLAHHPQLKGKTIWLQNFTTVNQKEEMREESSSSGMGEAERSEAKTATMESTQAKRIKTERAEVKRSESKKNEAGREMTEDYVLYFGRYSKEKGIETLVEVCRKLPEIRFVFAGKGPLEELVEQTANIENKGFLTGRELTELIKGARFSIYPSEWYENCPFSVMESIQYGTPVLGADIGGIPELIDDGITGEVFESGNRKELEEKIKKLWNDKKLAEQYRKNCEKKKFMDLEEYVTELKKYLE